MGKCYCDYCDVFLTNDSVAVRKQHNDGNRHKYNVCEYYRQYIGQKLQHQIDAIVHAFELKVAQGLICPSYGLPPPAKPVTKPNSDADNDADGNETANTEQVKSADDPNFQAVPQQQSHSDPADA